METPLPFFDEELDELLSEYELDEIEKKLIKSRLSTVFLVKIKEIFAKYEARISEISPEIDLENKMFWTSLYEKIPEIKDEIDIYMENELPDLTADYIAEAKSDKK